MATTKCTNNKGHDTALRGATQHHGARRGTRGHDGAEGGGTKVQTTRRGTVQEHSEGFEIAWGARAWRGGEGTGERAQQGTQEGMTGHEPTTWGSGHRIASQERDEATWRGATGLRGGRERHVMLQYGVTGCQSTARACCGVRASQAA
ncbi:hypothetical protein DENSPDRAFT_855619 [Dentipellis sp. KUC8613]|nr:hypothetical protein DENSPDRAFT_855619 [Dentipellis sp. KUC8613]